MGAITTGIGLISGINTAQLIDSLITLESRGKFNLQQRVTTLNTQRTALMDINARLLSLKSAAKAFRLDKIFQSALATSSDEEVLTAAAGANAKPGTYQFIVKQLSASSQKLSHGFADKTSPLGLTSLSFEFGHGGLAVDRDLEQLNGGLGVDRGRIKITDKTGAVATIDLTDVTTLNEVLERINAASPAKVNANVDGDRLIITDISSGSGSLTIANDTGDTTATDLGIAGTTAGTVITGTNINTIGGATALASLNDGTGVLTRNNVADFTITARDGTALDIRLGRLDLPITAATMLDDLNNGQGVTIGPEGNTDIKFIARDGSEHEVNLTGVTTVSGLISRVTTATAGKILISVHADGKRLAVTDTTGSTTSNLKVLGAGINGNETAEDLGILNIAGAAAASFDGQIVPNIASDPAATTVSDVIERINADTGNNGKIAASIASDGVSLLISDTTGGAGNLIIRRTAANPYAAAALGIETSTTGVASSSVDGERLIAGLGSVLVNNLNGGTGLGSAATLTLTDRSGASVTVSNLNTYDSLAEIISQINQQAVAAGVDITAALNNAGNGLHLTDSSGGSGNLIASGDGATALKIAGSVAGNLLRGSNLQLRYVSEATRLSDLNYGRGIGLGKFRITDGLGASADVDIDSDSTTLYDVIAEINSRGLAVKARVNDTGDGLLIEADLEAGETPFAKIKITAVSGSTARDLNILGESSTVENAKIDGSYERTVTLAETDTLEKVLSKINSAGIPVSASIINAGSGATPYRLNFTSSVSGRAGELLIDSGSVDLGLTTLTRGQDAKLFFGSDKPENGLLITSAGNSVTSVIDGVTINLLDASDDPVTLTVQRDRAAITDGVNQFVTAFNEAIARIDQYDFFDVETETKGPLLGNPTTSRVRDVLLRIVQGKAQSVATQYQYLRQVGVSVGANGRLEFNQEKFEQAYASDPQAVENLFAAFQSTPAAAQEIAPGVTVQQNQSTVTVRGFGDLFDNVLENFTNSIDGIVTVADKNMQSQIDLANKRITDFDKRLEAKRARLQSQFAAMETALSKLQNQGNAINALAGNVLLAQSVGLPRA